jgi:hypothetical protein
MERAELLESFLSPFASVFPLSPSSPPPVKQRELAGQSKRQEGLTIRLILKTGRKDCSHMYSHRSGVDKAY